MFWHSSHKESSVSSLSPSSALRPPPLLTWLASSAPPGSPSPAHLFSPPDALSASPQEGRSPWRWNQNEKATALNALPGSSLFSASFSEAASWQQCQGCTWRRTGKPDSPLRKHHGHRVQSGTCDPEAKNVSYAFLLFFERQGFPFYAAILINTWGFFSLGK